MKKLVRYRLLLLVVLSIGLSVLMIGTQGVCANEEEAVLELGYTPAEKTVAIGAANYAIGRLPQPESIVSYEQSYINDVANAFALVETAKEEFDAVDSDFPELAKLYAAEQRVLRMLAVKAAHDAIDALPPLAEITEEDREAVEEARRLVRIAVLEYGASDFELCWRMDVLSDAEEQLGEEEPEPEPEPEPAKPDDRLPTPSTGGLSACLAAGLLLSGTGLLFIKRRISRRK